MTELTQELLKELVTYNAESGVVIWNRRDVKHFKTEKSCKIWNTRFAGKRAGRVTNPSTTEYLVRGIRLFGKDYYEHRIVWLYVYGAVPEQIDHIDNNATNNKLENLRDGTSLNHLNRRMMSHNTSGVSGVHYCTRSKKWIAMCSFNKKRKNLGAFENKADAEQKVIAYRKSLGFSENHGAKKDAR